jgi:hypothetical protein
VHLDLVLQRTIESKSVLIAALACAVQNLVRTAGHLPGPEPTNLSVNLPQLVLHLARLS